MKQRILLVGGLGIGFQMLRLQMEMELAADKAMLITQELPEDYLKERMRDSNAIITSSGLAARCDELIKVSDLKDKKWDKPKSKYHK